MSIYDEILANARAKQSVRPLGQRPTYRGALPSNFSGGPSPRPTAFSRPQAAPSPTGLNLREVLRTGDFSSIAPDGDDGPGGLEGLTRDIFGGIIRAADIGKSTVQAYAGELGDVVEGLDIPDPLKYALNPLQLRGRQDENGENNTSFDFDDIGEQVRNGTQFQEHAPWLENAPGVVRPVVGFAGDIITDPLTYLTAGTVKAGTGLATGASRKVLAMDLAENIARKEATDILSDEVAAQLVRKVGQRGLGGFSKKSLKEIGTDADTLRAAGINVPEYGYSIGVGQKARLRVPGSGRLAETSEHYKGLVKQYSGNSAASRLGSKLFTSSKNSERVLLREILTGSENAPVAALGLSLLRRGKGEAETWMARAAEELSQTGVNKLKDTDARELTHAIEAIAKGADPGEVGAGVHQWLTGAGQMLQKLGIEGADGDLLKLRAGYMPHRLSEAARKNLDLPAVQRYIEQSATKNEAFQKVRQLEGSIEEINAAFRAENGVDFDLLEDNAHDLLTQYLVEGRDAIIRSHMAGKQARELGLVREMNEVIDDTAVGKALAAEHEAAATAVQRALQHRKAVASEGAKVLRKSRDEIRSGLNKAKRDSTTASQKVAAARSRIQAAEAELSALEVAQTQAERFAKNAAAKEKAAATRKIKEIAARREALQRQVDFDLELLTRARRDFGRLAAIVSDSEAQLAQADDALNEAEAFRSALEDAPFGQDVAEAQRVARRAEEVVGKQREKFAAIKDERETAINTNLWLGVEADAVANKLQTKMTEMDEWLDNPRNFKGRKGTPEQAEAARELRDRNSMLLDILRRNGNDEAADLAKIEAQAAVADMDALRAGRRAQTLSSPEKILNHPEFQKLVTLQSDIGYTQLGDSKWAMESWYKDAIEKTAEFVDPAKRAEAWRNFNKAISAYSKAQGWWKAWAVATPGFHIRNAYSGSFAMFIDGVSPQDAVVYRRFHKRWLDEGEEAAVSWATGKYGAEAAAQLNDAIRVTGASGWGITAEEAGNKLVGRKSNWNLLSSQGKITQTSQRFGETLESTMRGTHAYSVLRRGGSYQEALNRVEKFHFNYRDITEFDQASKLVMPFWTFFSRNIGLQLQVWARNPGKLNRSYFNAKRNIEFMSESDEPVPDYLLWSMGGIRTPWGGEESGRMYITPDLPSIRFRDTLADPFGQAISGLNPAIKAVMETATNRDTFTGREFKNDYTTWADDQEIPRLAPGVLQFPGVRNVADLLPGTELVNDKLLMTDLTQKNIETANPMIGRLNRLFPNMPRQQETRDQAVAGFLGGPIRWNDPGAQAGELARRDAQRRNEAADLALQAKLRQLTGGGS